MPMSSFQLIHRAAISQRAARGSERSSIASTPSKTTPSRVRLVGVTLATLALLGGCRTELGTRDRPTPQAVAAGSFVAGVGDHAVARPKGKATDTVRAVHDAATNPSALADRPNLSGQTYDPFTIGGGPPLAQAGGALPNQAVLLDAKVGDINGRPIYAGQFLAPIADRLAVEGQRLSRAQWMQLTERALSQRLDGMITDELLQGEALSTLSEQQRLGLRGFLMNMRTTLASQSLGSARLAEKRLLEQEGKTIDELVAQEEQSTLVRLSIQEQINKRINVSWRDVQQQYDRDAEIYNPPPTATFRLILVPTKKTEDIAEVQRLLDSGTPFSEVAASKLNRFKPEDGGLQTGPVDAEVGYEQTEFFGPEQLNEAAWALTPGATTGPFKLKRQTGWLTLEGFEQESVPLYDAQLEIYKDLLTERREEELDRYIKRLVERAKVSDRDEILRRLVDIAAERYAPAE